MKKAIVDPTIKGFILGTLHIIVRRVEGEWELMSIFRHDGLFMDLNDDEHYDHVRRCLHAEGIPLSTIVELDILSQIPE
jgi:hypothetical protein